MENSIEHWTQDPYECPNWKQGYALMALRDDRLGRGMLWPNREFVNNLVRYIRDNDCTGVSSIGSGRGNLEWLLSEHFDKLAVTCIDVRDLTDFPAPAKWHCKYGCASKNMIARIQKEDALFFSFPVPSVPFERYVQCYRVQCIIVIGDSSCVPFPGNSREIAKGFLPDWTLAYFEQINSGLTELAAPAFMSVFTRQSENVSRFKALRKMRSRFSRK